MPGLWQGAARFATFPPAGGQGVENGENTSASVQLVRLWWGCARRGRTAEQGGENVWSRPSAISGTGIRLERAGTVEKDICGAGMTSGKRSIVGRAAAGDGGAAAA